MKIIKKKIVTLLQSFLFMIKCLFCCFKKVLLMEYKYKIKSTFFKIKTAIIKFLNKANDFLKIYRDNEKYK